MKSRRLLLNCLVALLVMGGCERAERPAPREAAAVTAPPAPAADACERLSEAEIRRVAGLVEMGTVGAYRFHGEGSKLLCSEPGPGDVGECELAGGSVVRVESAAETFGLKAPAGTPVILRYGPEGFRCVKP